MLKIKDGYVMQMIGDSHYAVYAGAESNMPSMLSLNGVAALLFSRLLEGCETEALVSALLDEYDVSREVAERDVSAFIEKLEKAGML